MRTPAHPPKPVAAPSSAEPREPLRILSLSCVYPNSSEPGLGLFVRARLRHLSGMAEVKVLAPIASIDYTGASTRRFGRDGVPFRRADGATEVLHPMWLYPPGGGCLNVVLLFLRLLPCVIKVRERFRFHLIDAHFGYPEGIAACLLAKTLGVPFAITLRGNETMHAEHWLRGLMMRWALRRAERVITVSQRLGEFALSAGVTRDKVRMIPNGIDSSVFYPRDPAASREKHGLESKAKIILSVGALIKRKGHTRVLQAVRALAQEGIRCHLVIAGGSGREGDFERAIRRSISEFGMESVVRLEGQVPPDRLAELMSAADLLALASSREGWPNVVHEAMACGLPVVANDVGAIPQMIPSAEYGLVVPVNDQQALQDGLRKALQKRWDRQSISKWAHSRSWDGVAREVVAQMQQIVLTNEKGLTS
jgi:teichuronic acid biosynthesis glycosyltransferase TuaC